MDPLDLKENYIACIMCILTDWTPEQCFGYLEMCDKRKSTNITECDVLNMVHLKQKGHTYKEIGDLYGLSPGATRNRIMRFRQKRLCS
ncbi:MAG: helix-turn-helix domain-containing protein [Tepidanaerobacter acetatoxydans]|uniref:helix-turn-helix domain-containing protein n=1 Tax=Tepidanaerobacter acetatoxydans TaxID=499229 RepID=UPI0026EA2034|nr:helix-turn-helix domain-containing protein [Tepidanaerobacter acetatoxydans]NLU09415.1 helix-turn-helix domain-containing protein [Tepidanaerobacter acetatoxydans]